MLVTKKQMAETLAKMDAEMTDKEDMIEFLLNGVVGYAQLTDEALKRQVEMNLDMNDQWEVTADGDFEVIDGSDLADLIQGYGVE